MFNFNYKSGFPDIFVKDMFSTAIPMVASLHNGKKKRSYSEDPAPRILNCAKRRAHHAMFMIDELPSGAYANYTYVDGGICVWDGNIEDIGYYRSDGDNVIVKTHELSKKYPIVRVSTYDIDDEVDKMAVRFLRKVFLGTRPALQKKKITKNDINSMFQYIRDRDIMLGWVMVNAKTATRICGELQMIEFNSRETDMYIGDASVCVTEEMNDEEIFVLPAAEYMGALPLKNEISLVSEDGYTRIKDFGMMVHERAFTGMAYD